MTTQAATRTFSFDRLDIDNTLLATLAAIEEHLAGEINITDQVLVTCSSPRSVAIVGMLIGELEPAWSSVQAEPQPEDQPTDENHNASSHGICINCLRPFAPKRKDSHFCSKACRDEYKTKKKPVEVAPSGDISDSDPGYLVIKTGEFISKDEVDRKLANGEMLSDLRLRRAGDGEFEVCPLSTGQQILRRVL